METFEEKINREVEEFATHAEKMAYCKGMSCGLEQGREIMSQYGVKTIEGLEGVETTETKVFAEELNNEPQ